MLAGPLGHAVSLALGALLACAFAPLGWWPLAILCPAALMWLWEGAAPRRAAGLGFWFNVGTFTAGTYWLYTAIHVIGLAPVWLALFLIAALVAIMGAYHALLGYAVARWLPARGAVRWLVVLPAAWVLVEWWRGWFLSGFPWLALGYSQTDTWLAGYAPLAGVYGISALLLGMAGALPTLVRGDTRARGIAAAVIVVTWAASWPLARVEWTQRSGADVPVAILQGAVPQEVKWVETNHDRTLKLYEDLNDQTAGARLVVWPEAALPDIANNLARYLGTVYSKAKRRGADLVIGSTRASDEAPDDYFNSIIALGDDIEFYDKRHLVPFAEYFPVPDFVRQWARIMSLPSYDFEAGKEPPPLLHAAGLSLAATICYEDAYASAQLATERASHALVNVTNDAWFGNSAGRYLDFQISRMRAIEARRFQLRAANDGISAVVDPHGRVLAQAPQFEPHVLRGRIEPRQGATPYLVAGNIPVILLALAGLGAALWRVRRRYPGPARTSP